MKPAMGSDRGPRTLAWYGLEVQDLLLASFLTFGLIALAACGFREDGGVGGDTKDRKPEVTDAVWFTRYTMQEGGLGYVGVAGDGQVLAVEEIGHTQEVIERAEQIRTGSIPPGLRDRLFHIAMEEATYTARVEGPGEILFYEGILLRIGSRLGGTLRGADLVPIAGLSQEAREVLEEVVSWTESLPPDPEIRMLISAEVVDPERAERIRNDPRGFFSFVLLAPSEVESAPAVARAILYPGLLVVVEGEAEASQISDWLDRSNPDGVGRYLFLEILDATVYQVHIMSTGAD